MINQPIEEKWKEEFEKFIRHPITQKKNEPRMFFSVILADDVKSFIENLLEQERKRMSEEIEEMKTYTGGSSVNEKDKRVNKAEVLSILKH